MIRTILLALLISCHLFAQGESVYVVQALDESLGRVDPGSGTVNSHVLDLGAFCNEIFSDGTFLYVTNATSLQEISIAGEQTIRDIALPGCNGAWASARLNDDTMLVTCSLSDQVVLVRLSLAAVVGSLPVGNAPQGILVTDEHVFVTLTRLEFPDYGPGAVMIYDRRTLALRDSLMTGTNPQYIAVDSWNRIHVICTGDYMNVQGEIDIFDATTFDSISVLNVGGTPSTVAFSDVTAFVAAGGWGDWGNVYRYDLEGLTVMNDASSPLQVGSGATDVGVLSDGSFVVSCFHVDAIEHRAANGALIQSHPVSDGPGYLVVHSETGVSETPQGFTKMDYGIRRAYPNPFNGEVSLEFNSRLRESVNINVYNSLGQLIDVLRAGAGSSSVSWSPGTISTSSLASGAYYVRLDGGHHGNTVQLQYMK